MPIHWNTPKDAWQDFVQHVAERTVEESWHLADYYHGAPTSERDRIEAWGLQPGNPQLNGRWLLEDAGFSPEDAMMQNHHRTTDPSVFMTTDPEDAYKGRPGENDVWRIDPSYLNEEDLGSDPLWQNARVSPREVPPEALSLHAPAEDAIWDLHQGARKEADAATVFNPVAPIDELTGFLDQNGGSAMGLLNPNNPLSEDADPNANTANPNMNPANPNAFANPANPALNAALPTAQTNPANPQFNPSVPGAQNNPSNPMYNPSVPGSTNNSANPELNPNYPGSMTNPSNPIHNPDWPNPEGVPQRPMQARTWEPKQSWTFEPEVGYEVPDVGDELAGSVVSEMDNLSVHLEDGRGMAADQAQALRDACLRLASALEPVADKTSMTKRSWNPFKYTPEPAPSPQEAAQGRMCYFHPDRPAVAAEGFAAMCPECYERYQSAQRGEQYQAPQVEQQGEGVNQPWQGLYDQARGWDRQAASYWHLTDDPNFNVDPQRAPFDATAPDQSQSTPGLMVSQDPHYWASMFQSHPEELAAGEYENPNPRGYLAEIDLSGVPADQHWLTNRGFGDERWINAPAAAQVKRVWPLAEGLQEFDRQAPEREAEAWGQQRQAADIPGSEMSDSHDWPDPTEPRSSEPPAPPLCTCAEGLKLECPVHGLHATDPENDDLWGRWHLPEGSPVGFPAQTGQPRGWQAPYVNS